MEKKKFQGKDSYTRPYMIGDLNRALFLGRRDRIHPIPSLTPSP